MKKTIKLPDGKEIVVRQPTVKEDLDKLVKFLSGLPDETRNFLRYDVTEVEPSRERLRQVDGKDHWRLIAEQKGKIVGDATLDRQPFVCTRHVAELRGVFDARQSGAGIGNVLFKELVALGAQAGIERLFSEVMDGQTDIIAMLEEAGFVREGLRRKFAKDLHGNPRDVIIMSNDLEAAWNRLAEHLEELDLGHSRGA